MSTLNFPQSPSVGDQYTFNEYIYRYDGEKWTTISLGNVAALRGDLANNSDPAKGAALIGYDGSTVAAALGSIEKQLEPQATCAQYAKALSSGTAPIISCYGDSTMWGASVENLVAQSPTNAPAMLAQALLLVYSVPVTVNNRGISATTLRSMLAGTDGSGTTFESKISVGGMDESASIIYCNHCINDSQLDLDINQYRRDLAEFINLCREKGKVPVLVTPNPNPPLVIIDSTKSKRLDHYVRTMRDVAAQFGVDLVDNYHYFNETAKRIPMDVIVPDGAHLSHRGYRQAGYNMAIPLVCAKTLKTAGDSAGITNVSWYSNSSTLQILDRDGLTGPTLYIERQGMLTGINYPVVIDTSVRQVSVIGLQWTDADNGYVTHHNDSTNRQYYPQRAFGDAGLLKWDAEYVVNVDVWAGLNIFGVFFDIPWPGIGDGLTFGGIALPTLNFSGVGAPAGVLKAGTIHNGSRVVASVPFTTSTGIELCDLSGEIAISIDKSAGNPVLKLWREGVVVQSTNIGGAPLVDGVYGVQIEILPDTISANIGILGASISIGTPMPELTMKTTYLPYYVYNPY